MLLHRLKCIAIRLCIFLLLTTEMVQLLFSFKDFQIFDKNK